MSAVSRRRFLLQASTAALGGGAALFAAASCRRVEFACTDVSGLAPEALAAREGADYVDRSGDPARSCLKCQQWTPPTSSMCGGCKLIAGPIHPQGSCRLFVPR